MVEFPWFEKSFTQNPFAKNKRLVKVVFVLPGDRGKKKIKKMQPSLQGGAQKQVINLVITILQKVGVK